MLCFRTWKCPLVGVAPVPLFKRSFHEARSLLGAPSFVNSLVSPILVVPFRQEWRFKQLREVDLSHHRQFVSMVIFQTALATPSFFQAAWKVGARPLAEQKRRRNPLSRYGSPSREELHC